MSQISAESRCQLEQLILTIIGDKKIDFAAIERAVKADLLRKTFPDWTTGVIRHTVWGLAHSKKVIIGPGYKVKRVPEEAKVPWGNSSAVSAAQATEFLYAQSRSSNGDATFPCGATEQQAREHTALFTLINELEAHFKDKKSPKGPVQKALDNAKSILAYGYTSQAKEQ